MALARTKSGDGVIGISRRRGQASITGSSPHSKIAAYVICFLVVYVVGTTIYQSHFAGMFVPDIEVDEFGRSRVRRRPHRHKQRLDPSKSTYVLASYLVQQMEEDMTQKVS